MIGCDCVGRPIHVGDVVERVYTELKTRHIVLGPANPPYPVDGAERGYIKVSDSENMRGFSQRFGINLRVVVDEDLIMDAGL